MDAFIQAIVKSGITPPIEIIDDGEIHRFSSSGKPHDKAGWYVFYPDGVKAGSFGCWRVGLTQTWSELPDELMKPAEIKLNAERVAQAKAKRDAELDRSHAEAATQAQAMLGKATEADDHPYLKRKGVESHGVKVLNDILLVPMRDVTGKIWNVERIDSEGNKKGLSGGRRTGLYFTFGTIKDEVLICEGFSTGASIHEATGKPVAASFNAGNLPHVAQALRNQNVGLDIVICGDDDRQNEINSGREKAEQAAKSVGGRVVFPKFKGDAGSDFNDMAAESGLTAVHNLIGGVKTTIPDETARPCFVVFDKYFESNGDKFKAGVWYFTVKTDKAGVATLVNTWVCSPLHVEAVTYDSQDNNFGRMLRYKNTLGRWHTWAMPMDLLAGAGDEMRAELLGRGVEIDPANKLVLSKYIQYRPPKKQMTCALQTGWHGNVFVLPDAVIGEDAGSVIYQSAGQSNNEYTKTGTVQGWIDNISLLAVDNPVLMLSISAAFAAPLMDRTNVESGGIHWVGDSSTGKTTSLDVASSVWGGTNYKRSWRSTSNGMEGAAAMFNDCLLAMDEISECDPREVGAIVYALGNGRGKQRAGRSGSARSVTKWRCFVLSTGERTIATSMMEGGKRPKAGQAVRLLDIPCARTYGAWDDLHGHDSGVALSDHLKRAVKAQHGVVGRAYLERLTRDTTNFTALLDEYKNLPELTIADGEGQERRAATRFALIAMAGELATEYGLTGWSQGDAIKAASTCMTLWRDARGKGNGESKSILTAISSFVDKHGDSRFSSVSSVSDVPVRDRAGWFSGDTYHFTPDGLKEATKGFDLKRVIEVLVAAKWMPAADSSGKAAQVIWAGGKSKRLYSITVTDAWD
jgi:putative DNA primase/helicase